MLKLPSAAFVALRAVAIVAVMFATGASARTARDMSDNFDDNSINDSLWRVRTIGGVSLRENNQRLEFRTSGPIGDASGALLEMRKKGVNWQRNFSVSIDYVVDIPEPRRDQFAAVTIALAFTEPNPIGSGVAIGVARADDGYWLAWFIVSDSQIVDFSRKRLSGPAGTLRVSWKQSRDRMTITADGEKLRVRNLYRDYGDEYGEVPVILRIGAGAEGADIDFSASDVNIDDFEFSGHTRRR